MRNSKAVIGQAPGVDLTDTPEDGVNALGWITVEKVAFDHVAIVPAEYGESLGTSIDRMLAEYRERGETLRSFRIEFPDNERPGR